MGGLLYKDYVAVNGKKIVWILVIATVVFTVLRVLFPGTAGLGRFVGTMEDGKMFNLIDSLFFLGEYIIILFGTFIINNMEPKIMEFDEKNRIRSYLFSMPVKREKYVASKYLFIGIAMYIILSLYMLWHVVSAAFMAEGYIQELSGMVGSFAVSFLSLLLFMAAVEMPLYFILGKEKAKMVRVAIWLLIDFGVVWFLFFGDLALIKNLDFEILMNWLDAHTFEITLLTFLSPLVSLGLYYLSYRITVGLYGRREIL